MSTYVLRFVVAICKIVGPIELAVGKHHTRQ